MSDDKHEKARELTEQALDKLVEGDEAAADKLISEAKKLDITAPQEVLEELDEDASRTGQKP